MTRFYGALYMNGWMYSYMFDLGEGGLEVRGHGARPSLPLDIHHCSLRYLLSLCLYVFLSFLLSLVLSLSIFIYIYVSFSQIDKQENILNIQYHTVSIIFCGKL